MISGVRKLMAVLLAACSTLYANDIPGAGSPSLRGESHAWVALPLEDGGAAIVHIPPRRDVTRTDGRGDAEDGSLHMVGRVAQVPERLAAWDRELWLVFDAEPAGPGKRQRRVLTMHIECGPLAGAWVPSPQGERLPTAASLPGDGSLVGLVGTPKGPAALLQLRADSTGRPRYSLLVLSGSEWRDLALPERWWRAPGSSEDGGAGARLELVSSADGPMLVVVDERQGGVWSGTFGKEPPPAEGEASVPTPVLWEWSSLSFAGGRGVYLPAPGSPIMSSGGQLAFVSDGNGRNLIGLSRPSARVLASVAPGRDFALVSLDQVGRVALVWQEAERTGPAPQGQAPGVRRQAASPKTNIIELSASTGHVLYEGAAKVGGPVSSQELKLLAIALVGVMVVVVTIILKPNAGDGGVSLPKGYALAEPGRRMVAGAIDVLLAMLVVSAVLRVSVFDLLSADLLARGSGGVGALLLIMAVGFAHSTLGDWLVGRSIGKVATGCIVVRPRVTRSEPSGELQPMLARPALWRAAVRNLICWLLPPVAMWGMGGPDHRHRGDVVSGLMVVVEIDESDPA